MAWFQASEQGNGIGLTVLRATSARLGIKQSLFIYVLPKFWRETIAPATTSQTWLLDTDDLAYERTTISLYERDILGLPEAWGEVLRKAVTEASDESYSEDSGASQNPEHNLKEVDIEAEDGTRDRLWREVVDLRTKCSKAVVGGRQTIDGFWQLIKDEISPILADPPPGISVLIEEPSARRAYLEFFLDAARNHIARRRPEFRPSIEALNAIRGRMLVPELVRRSAYRTLPVWCEFDSLTADTHVWQAIRRAVIACANEMSNDSHLLDLALESDARLSDVPIESIPVILATAATEAPTIRDRDLRAVHRVALAILRHEVLLAEPARDESDGLVFMFKVATSRIWERLVAEAVNSTKKYVAIRNPDGKRIFANGEKKCVDIAVYDRESNGDLVLILDGKYKSAPASISNAAMGDQYQIYAYANLWGVPAFLVYPGGLAANIPRSEISVALVNHGGHAGIVQLAFPEPGKKAAPVEQKVITELLDRITSGDGPRLIL